MSTYTTGEIAKLCDVTVRTVQYYDKEDLLHPSAVSEGGRRLYSEADVNKLKEICMMKSLGAPLSVIKDVMADSNGHELLKIFLDEQLSKIAEDINELEDQKNKILAVKENIDIGNWNTVKSEHDINNIMKGKKRLAKVKVIVLSIGFVIDALEVAGIVTWIYTGKPWFFIASLIISFACVFPFIPMIYNACAYICPDCHAKFMPNKKEWFFAKHTPKFRKLTCTSCGYHGYCIETYSETFNK